MATRLYILYLAADESISGWEFYCLIPKSPQVSGKQSSLNLSIFLFFFFFVLSKRFRVHLIVSLL